MKNTATTKGKTARATRPGDDCPAQAEMLSALARLDEAVEALRKLAGRPACERPGWGDDMLTALAWQLGEMAGSLLRRAPDGLQVEREGCPLLRYLRLRPGQQPPRGLRRAAERAAAELGYRLPPRPSVPA